MSGFYDTHEVWWRSKDKIRKDLEKKSNEYAQEHKDILSSWENLRAEWLYKAWCQILDLYEMQMKDSNIFSNLATDKYESMRQLKEKYKKSYEAVVNLQILPDFDSKIDEMVHEIDQAENITLEKLKLLGEQRLERSRIKSVEKKLLKKIGNLNEKEGIYFTSGANWVSTNVLKEMFETRKWDLIYESTTTGKEYIQTDITHDNSQKTLILDYSHCTNTNLKTKVMEVYWTTYLEVKRKYNDLLINWMSSPVKLWEWVTLHEKESQSIFMKNDELKELKDMKHRLTSWLNISDYTKNPELDENLKQYTNIIPEDLKEKLKGKGSTNDYMNYNKFLDETDKRISELIIEANAKGLIFKEPPMKEDLELNLRNDWNEFKRLMWGENNKNILWNELYNIIKDNDEDYADYINDLIKIKQPNIEQETNKNIALKRYEINADSPENGKDKLTEEEKERMQLWLNILKEYIWVCRTKKDSEELSTIHNIINEEEERLRFVNPLSKKAIQERTINKILMNFFDEWSISRESTKNIVTKRMNDLFYWNKEEQLEAIIGINSQNWFRWVTKSDVEEIIKRSIESLDTTSDNKDEWWGLWGLHLRDRDREKMRENIWKLLSITPNWFETDENWWFITKWDKIVVKKEYQKQQDLIDELYQIAETKEEKDIAAFLVRNGILPKEWEGWKDIQETCSEIKKALNENSKSAIEIKEKDIENMYNNRKKELEKKRAKSWNEFSEEEQAELDGIKIILENKNSTIDQIKNELIHQQNYIKYCWWVSNIINSALLHHLTWWYGNWMVDKYWYTTTVTRYYQDIYWINTFHISTRTLETITTIAREIAITVAICCLTWWSGSAIVSWMLRWTATAARAARAVKLANTIKKGVKIGAAWVKAVDGVWSATYRLLQTATSYWLEWTIFDIASNIIHWEDINANPLARENVKTSMFLASLWLANAIVSWIWKVWGKIIETVWNKSKLMLKWINWTKSMPNTIRTMKWWAELITEAWTMMAWESFCNIVFWHEVIDPETQEKVNKPFDWPDEASWTQMMWIIISFKFAKPKLRWELKMKLDEWTLEICNSSHKGKFLIGNDKIWYFELSEQWIIKAISSKWSKATKKKSEKSKDHKENEQAKQWENNSNYFDWKSHQFEITEEQARSNSENMDRILSEINEQNKSEKLQELREEINKQYTQATWEEPNLTDEQLLSILDAHEQDWILWELTLWQLKVKVKTLSEAITNEKVIRFLLEAWFCGKEWFSSPKLEVIYNRLKNETGLSDSQIKLIMKFNNIENETVQNFIIFCAENEVDSGLYYKFCSSELTSQQLNKRLKFIENLLKKRDKLRIYSLDWILGKGYNDNRSESWLYDMIEENCYKDTIEPIEQKQTERKLVREKYNKEFKKQKAEKEKQKRYYTHTEFSETSQMSAKEKLFSILNKSIDDLKSIDALTENEKLLIINHARSKLKSTYYDESWLSLCEGPIESFVAEYLYDLWFPSWEVKYLIRKTREEWISFNILDAYKNHANYQPHSIPDEIFDRNKMIDVLIKFGFIPYRWYYLPNNELNWDLSTENDYKILTTDDIDIMHRMINIGNHKNFWKNLSPQVFLRTFYQFKSLFEKEPVWWYRGVRYQKSSLIDRKGEDFFDKVLTEYENSWITEEELDAINDYVASLHWQINRALINNESGAFREKWENLRKLIQRFPVVETLELNRTERDAHRFDEVKLKDWTTLTQIIKNIGQYADRIDEINEELRSITLHNKAFMSTSEGHLYSPMWSTGWDQINWLIYLEKGSHALFRNIYSQTSQWEFEYIIQADSDIIFQIEIINGFPKLIGYVKTP